MPACRQASISSPARPKIIGSPPFSRTTRRPDRARPTMSALISDCLHERPCPVLPTSMRLASRRAKSSTSFETRSSYRITSADCSARTARSVSNSGSPGPAPTSVTEPCSAAVACAFASRSNASKVVPEGSPFGSCSAVRVKTCQNSRRPLNVSPDCFTASRQLRAAAPQRANPAGSMASIRVRIACAKTGAAPSVEIATTSGERLTIAPNEKSQ